jgi:putative aminopeptidase FrvX
LDLALLDRLTQTHGPSGYEDTIRATIAEAIEPFAGETRVDPLGSLVSIRRAQQGQNEAKRIILAAHMDEIGLIVTHVEEKGFAGSKLYWGEGQVFQRCNGTNLRRTT